MSFNPNFGEYQLFTIEVEKHHGQLAWLKDRG